MSILRLILATVISSTAIVPLYLVVAFFTGDIDNMLLSVILLGALSTSIAAVVIVGLPTHLILKRIGRVRGVYYALVGFMVPAIVTAVVHPLGEDGIRGIAEQSVYLGLFGAAIALIFWKVVTYETAT